MTPDAKFLLCLAGALALLAAIEAVNIAWDTARRRRQRQAEAEARQQAEANAAAELARRHHRWLHDLTRPGEPWPGDPQRN